MTSKSWYVYLLECMDGTYYTGITNNPDLRIIKHNSGRGSQMAIQQGPFKLIYVSKEFPNKSSARIREAQIKKWTTLRASQFTPPKAWNGSNLT